MERRILSAYQIFTFSSSEADSYQVVTGVTTLIVVHVV
jgi:hypothetical protein